MPSSTKKISQVIETVSLKITPSEKEKKKVSGAVEEALKICRKCAKNSEVILCGSFAKETYLSGIRDVDIFLIVKEGKLAENEGVIDAEACAKALSPKGYAPKFSSHKYFTAQFKGYSFDIVPAYPFKPGEELRSSVDRTPLHAEYVNGKIQEKRGAARLIKAFCKGIGAYGADSKCLGFSGYLCELLAIEHGSFEAFLSKALEMKHPLEFPDPVDPERNVAAAVSEETIERLKSAAGSFLSKPSERFFFPKKTGATAPKISQKKHLFVIYKESFQNEDALYAKARSALTQLAKDVSDLGFSVRAKSFGVRADSGEVLLAFEFEKLFLPRTRIIEGPPLSVRRDYIDAFVAKHGKDKIRQEKGRLYAKDARKIFEAKPALVSMGRTFLPTFAIVESQKAFSAIFKGLSDSERARLATFLSGKETWEI